jgi:hypothetical protein
MFRTHCTAIAFSLLLLAPLSAQQRYSQFNSADIKVPYPDGWDRTVLSAEFRAAFIEGPERSFVVNRIQVSFPVKFNEAFAEIEERSVRDDFPGATQLTKSTVGHAVHGSILQVDFTIPGVSGRNPRALRVRHVSIPVGRFTYRVTCVAREDEFKSKYDSVFKYMIDRLVITPPVLKEGSE